MNKDAKTQITNLQDQEHYLLKQRSRLQRKRGNHYIQLSEINKKLIWNQNRQAAICKQYDFWGVFE